VFGDFECSEADDSFVNGVNSCLGVATCIVRDGIVAEVKLPTMILCVVTPCGLADFY
jgi:hypothetical protein